MKKITLILFFLFTPFVFFGQQCPEPVGDAVQYFCNNATPTLANLNVTGATLTWYDDAAGTTTIPDTTPIVNGETYYVSNTDIGCTESNLLAITAYKQTLHFNVSPISCFDFGGNAFFVNPADVVEIETLNINGNPINSKWEPNGAGSNLYTDNTLTQSIDNQTYSEVFFGNAAANQVYTYAVISGAGVCPSSTMDITIYNGAYIFYYCGPTTLGDIEVDGYPTLTWYADAAMLIPVPDITPVNPGDMYYADVNDASCTDVLPVYIEDVVPEPRGSSVQYFCTGSSPVLDDLDIRGDNLTWYLDGNVIPGSTTIVHGETYAVTQTINSCESDEKEVTVYMQSLHLSVDPASCLVLGPNKYLVDPTDVVEISVFDINGDPIDVTWDPTWSPNAANSYIYTDNTLTQNVSQPSSTVYFGNAIPNQAYTYTVYYGGGICPATSMEIIIYNGAYIFCYDGDPATTLADIEFDEYPTLTWYEDEDLLVALPDTTIVVPGETYYADVNDASCTDILPVYIHVTPPPSGPSVQYFCTDSNALVQDLNVTGINLKWYLNGVQIPENTPIVDGATYTVTQCISTCESQGLEITVHKQSLRLNVNPQSCFDLGNNVYLVDPADIVEINLLDINGNLINGNFTPVGVPLYIDAALTFPHFNFAPGFNTVYFGNAQPNQVYNFTVSVGAGVCPPESQSFTIFTGAFIYDDFCYGDTTTTLEDLGVPGTNLTWYSDAGGTNVIPETTVVQGNTTYYAGFGDSSCPDLLPVIVRYKVGPPMGEDEQGFCLSSTWANAGLPGTPSDRLADFPICGLNLKWYDSNGALIPATTVPVDGATYFVTQTINGCESEPLEIVVAERFCSCIKQNTASFEFHRQTLAAYNECNIYNLNGPISLGPPNAMGTTDWAVPTTSGFDPHIPSLTRTSPFVECTNNSYRINNDTRGSSTPTGGSSIVSLKKKFIAGEVVAFDFSLVLQSPTHADPPFFQINIFDQSGGLYETRCLTSNPTHCIFNSVNIPLLGLVVYSEWSCLKFNTQELQGELVTMEIIMADCEWTGHFAYAYVDNFRVGDDGPGMCDDSSFGYLSLQPIEATTNPDYNACSIIEVPTQEECDAALPILNPEFPFNVCALSSSPTIATGQTGTITPATMTLQILRNGTVVGSSTTLVTPPPGSPFNMTCFEINETDINVPLYGYFDFRATDNYAMNCGNPFNFPLISDMSGFKICPVAECVALYECTPTASGDAMFTLADAIPLIAANYDYTLPNPEVLVTFYNSAANAHAQTGQITTVTTSVSATVYARLDFNWAHIGIPMPDDCYDIVELELVVGVAPDVPEYPSITELVACQDPITLDYIFDFTLIETDLLSNIPPADHPDYTWEFFGSLPDAEGNINQLILTPSGEYILPSTPTPPSQIRIYIRVTGPDGCYAITSFDIIPSPEIQFNQPLPYLVCSDLPGYAFVLADISNDITTDPDLDVTFYLDSDDAADAINELPGPNYTNTTSPETIYVRIEDTNGCFVITSVELIVNPNPVPGMVNDMVLCDSGNGSADFDLTIPRDEIINGQFDMTATFYLTQAEAEAGTTGQLPLLYTATGGPTTIYVRLEDDITECFTIETFTIEVIPAPPITFPITDYFECDNDQDGFENFDLTSKESEILGTIPPASVTVTYHNSFADADAGVGEINPATVYNSAGGETIFVRVAYNVDPFCYSVGQFELGLHPPVAYNAPAPLQVCDEGAANGIATFNLSLATTQITGNDPNLSVSYHFDQPDADNGVNQLPLMYQNQTPYFQTIWVRVVNQTTGCYATAPLDLIVEIAPAAIEPDPLTYCDPDNDGFGSFTLTDAESQITGGAVGVDVTYHLTQADANNGVNAIDTTVPFYNTVQYTQTLYVRVEISGIVCYNTTTLTLQVLDTPQLVVPADLVACDYNGNGTATFDLTEVEPQLLVNITNPGNYSIYYYASAADMSNDNPIAVPGAYTNVVSPQQTIYVVVEDDTNGCTTEVSFDLIVVDLPEIFPPTPLELCDVNNPGDEQEEFDLSLATLEITGGDTSILVTYHETQADADAGTNPIGPLYTNTINNQTIYIRVVSQDGCVISQGYTLTLIVNPLPSPEEPAPLVVCDPNSDGFALFDLDSKIDEILNNEPNVDITFHETFVDAQDGIFALTSPYLNIVQYQQTIYVRAENTLTGCFAIVELELLVDDSPAIPLELDDLVVCSEDQTEIGIIFNLTEQDAAIYGSQDPDDFTLTYHLTQADAQAGTGAIVNPSAYANTSNPQTIWVRLVDDATGCYSTGSFELLVNLPPDIPQPGDLPPYELCDDEERDGFRVFDLTYMTPFITMGEPGLEVQYYLSLEDAQQQIGQINPDTAFTNTVPGVQNIWVRVYDDDTGCDAYTRILLRVLPNPSPNDPDPIALCDTEGNGEQVFDLTIREAQILGNEPDVSLTYYETREEAEEGDPANAIQDPENYTNIESPQQIIYVRVESDINGCYVIVELLLIIDSLPELEVEDYIVCEANNDGFAQFDLTTKITEITSPLPPGNYLVSFHEVEGDEDVPQNAIPVSNLPSYTNLSNPQTLYVRLENTDTGCFVTGQFDLIVEEGATATAPAAPLIVCEDEVGSGIGTFDLTQLNAEILNGQAPPDYELSYHETQGDAEAGINAIPESSHTNYQSPTQTIWARVTNTDTDCYEIVAIELQVLPIPELVDFQDSYRLCVDAFGNVIPEDFGPTSPPTIDTGLSTPDYIFIWEIDGQIQFDETQGSITATQGGIYTVTVIDVQTGCEVQASTTVVLSSPPITYSAQTVTSPFAGSHAIGAEAQGLGDYIFSLDDGPYQDVGYWENVTPGTHTVTITDRNGCGSVTVEVGVIDYPLFFTPNNDGYNDRWNIIGIANYPSAKIYIFDRYGKLLKQLSPTGLGWDGTYNGRPLPSSDYWFKVEYLEEGVIKEFRGHFTLKR